MEVVYANRTERIAVDRSAYFRGVVAGYGPDHSDVRAHIDKGKLTGSIRVRTRIFRVEPANSREHPHLGNAEDAPANGYNHVVYSDEAMVEEVGDGHNHAYCGLVSDDEALNNTKRDMDAIRTQHSHDDHASIGQRQPDSTTGNRNRRQTFNIDDHNTCDMRLIADHRFFTSVGGGSVLNTQNRLIDILEGANVIFKAANFQVGGTVQLAIRKMSIFTTSSSSSTGESNPHSIGTSSSSSFLDQLSAESQGQYCLAHSFTYQDFDNGVLGLAFVGTICSGFSSTSTPSVNTGITTSLNQGSPSSTLQTNIVFTHEVGILHPTAHPAAQFSLALFSSASFSFLSGVFVLLLSAGIPPVRPGKRPSTHLVSGRIYPSFNRSTYAGGTQFWDAARQQLCRLLQSVWVVMQQL